MKYKDFTSDIDKMTDFILLSKNDFLTSYPRINEKEYNLTIKKVLRINGICNNSNEAHNAMQLFRIEMHKSDFKVERCKLLLLNLADTLTWYYENKSVFNNTITDIINNINKIIAKLK